MSRYLPLSLHCNPGTWRPFSMRRQDEAFKKFATAVWQRDAYQCRFCGFQSQSLQEVVNIDHDYNHNSLDNMATACCFCTQCFFIDFVGKNQYGGGTIIYLPEMSQAKLNGLCHVLFCAIVNATPYAEIAQTILRNLKLRSQEVEQSLGDGMSHPAHLGFALTDARLKNRSAFEAMLFKDLRLLPSKVHFEDQLQLWSGEALKRLAQDDSTTVNEG